MAEEILAELMAAVDQDPPPIDIVTQMLNGLAETVCTEGPATRDKILELGAYVGVCRAWIFCCYSGVPNVNALAPGAKNCRDAVLRALYALTPGHADIIDDVGWQIIAQALDKNIPERTQILVVKLLRNVFIKNEANRDHFSWNLGLLPPLLSLIFKPKLSNEFLCEWCGALKAAILTDDVRVAYNEAGIRKRAIAKAKVLPIIAAKLNDREYEYDVSAINAIVVLLASMAITDEICEQIDSANILQGIRSIYKNYPEDKGLIRNTTNLLRHLCTCRGIREKVAQMALMKWVVDSILKYQKSRDVVEEGIACCACMTARNSCHVAQFMSKNGLQLTLQIMTDYKDRISILKNACVILRNVAENGGVHGKEKLRDVGFGILLNQLQAVVIELKEFYIHPILKELESLDRISISDDHDHHHHHPLHEDSHRHHHHGDALTPSSIFDNVSLEPKAGRKSIVLDGSDDDD